MIKEITDANFAELLATGQPMVVDFWEEDLELFHRKGLVSKYKRYDLWEKEGIKDEANPLLPYNVTEPVVVKSYICENGEATEVRDNRTIQLEGRLIGGCMDILQMYPGTPYDKVREFNEKYKEDGFIWFMESCYLNLMGIRRAIWQLKQAGWLEHLKGFLIGRPLCFGEEAFGIDQYQAFQWMVDLTVEEVAYVEFVNLDDPKPGQQARAVEVILETTEAQGDGAEPTEDMSTIITGAARLNAALNILQQLEKNDIVGAAASIDVGSLSNIELWYGQRFQVKLGDANNMDIKISWMKSAVNQRSEYDMGILDVSFTTWPDRVGYTPIND